MKCIILARVSSKEQEQGKSIKAQIENSKKYCERNKLEIIKSFEIVESSTRGKRKSFNDMLAFVKKQSKTTAIVADAVDRIQRSFKESILLDDLIRQDKIELHFIREGLIVNTNSNSSAIMQWDFAVMGAKTYILNLRDNTKRSMNYKLNHGEWIGKAPLGYKNIKDSITKKSTVVLDKERAYLVRWVFKEYAKGGYSISGLADLVTKKGLRTNKGNVIKKANLHQMLKTPFYCGYMQVKEKLYKHNYETLIDESTFEKCKELRLGWGKKRFKYASKPFIFRGLVKCSYCGCAISSELHKNKYIYLSCSKYKGNCDAIRIREEVLLEQVKKALKNIKIQKNLLEDIKNHLQSSHIAKKTYQEEALNRIDKEYKLIQKKLDSLLDMRLEQSITTEVYDKKAYELKKRQYELEDEHKRHTVADEKFNIALSTVLELASKSYKLFESSKVDEKRQIINLVLSNLKLEGETLQFNYRKPFDMMLKKGNRQVWGPLGDDLGTFKAIDFNIFGLFEMLKVA